MKKRSISFLMIISLLMACAPKTIPSTLPATVPESTNASLLGTRWKLVELMGKPVQESEWKQAGFLLLQANGGFSASAGCNSLMGSYTLKEPFGISFLPNMASTLMACPNQEKEDQFKKMLMEVNAYQLAGQQLSFSKNKMAPFARFEAVSPEK